MQRRALQQAITLRRALAARTPPPLLRTVGATSTYHVVEDVEAVKSLAFIFLLLLRVGQPRALERGRRVDGAGAHGVAPRDGASEGVRPRLEARRNRCWRGLRRRTLEQAAVAQWCPIARHTGLQGHACQVLDMGSCVCDSPPPRKDGSAQSIVCRPPGERRPRVV